ncbi:hypothetical protein COLO4_10210 [Corchorus olitorius]|uniref:Uncharacterized protein n=1 Tax=Corchorus olitorius TaxID=93759 RepID=A0A1R3K9L5_9ROSI|nr:hypothetical protein COLO4_10210 [Corchorus olitorius]
MACYKTLGCFFTLITLSCFIRNAIFLFIEEQFNLDDEIDFGEGRFWVFEIYMSLNKVGANGEVGEDHEYQVKKNSNLGNRRIRRFRG